LKGREREGDRGMRGRYGEGDEVWKEGVRKEEGVMEVRGGGEGGSRCGARGGEGEGVTSESPHADSSFGQRWLGWSQKM